MLESAQSCFTSLAADRVSAAAAFLTSSPKTRVWGSRCNPPGRMSRRARRRSMFTPGSRACAYRTASGRAKWPNRDPLGEMGGRNLYTFVHNNPITFWDKLGLMRSGNPSDTKPSPPKPCCENNCDKEGAIEVTGHFEAFIPGDRELGDPDQIEKWKKVMKKCKPPRRTPYSYIRQPASAVIDEAAKLAHTLEEFQNGVKVYTSLSYQTCSYCKCSWWDKLNGRTKSVLTWMGGYSTEPRQCKPGPAEGHPQNPGAFIDHDTAQAAISRCVEEHARELESSN